ncbi:hypothetical protein JCM5353_001197 [Sporobolomyces roseus]
MLDSSGRPRRRTTRSSLSRFAFSFILLSATRFSSVNGFWRLPCQGKPLVSERADPLTNPGGISQHVHAIHGGSNFNLDMDSASARKGDCASCKVKQDMSNYWTPYLYFHWKNGSFTSLREPGLLVYYLQRFHESDTTEVLAFPEGMRMLAGNPYVRSYNESSLMSKAIGWNCLGGETLGMEKTRNPSLPPVNCPNGLRGEIMFPSCWDGENVDSTNHISHMAYPADNEAGPCPPTHPKRVVTIFYEIVWDVDSFKDDWENAMNTSQPFVLSTGDPLGYGYHGDFLNGWDIDVLQKAVTECTAESGVIEECPVFDFFDWEIEHTPEEMSCIQSPGISEPVLGTLDALPGCNPIDYGPGDVTVCNEENPPSIERTVEISGYVLDGNKTLEVSRSTSGGTNAGGGVTNGHAGTSENDNFSSTSNSSSSNSPSDRENNSASSPSTSIASSSSTESSATSASAFERNKALILCLIVALPVLVFVTIVLCCKFSCGRERKSTLRRERAEDAELAQEEQALQEPLTTDSDMSSSSSDSEDSRLDRRKR